MKIKTLHPWDLTVPEAIGLQRELALQVETRTPIASYRLIAGADVSYGRFSDIFFACVVVLDAPSMAIVEEQYAVARSPFPYVPGLLSFREAPVLLEAFAQLKSIPDVVLFDGQGIAHPRRLGIASHIGLWIDLPSIGCAKSLLTGRYTEPGVMAGSISPLKDRDEVIGKVVRTKTKVKPLFISVGHRADLDSAVRITLETCRGYRLPEPTRQAHLRVNEYRRQHSESSK